MHQEIHNHIEKLSSRKVLERKKAIRELARYIHHPNGYLARLSLHYVSVHDPSYTVRNIARQAFYKIGEPPSEGHAWDRAYLF
jgi:hypothetical protein